MTDPNLPPPERPTESHTTINVSSPDRGGGGGALGFIIGGLVVVVLVIAAVMVFNGRAPIETPAVGDINVDVDVPAPKLPETPDLPTLPPVEPPTVPSPSPAPN